MLEVNRPPRRLRFAAFEVDLQAGELQKHGIRIRLQAQPFRVLEMLLEHPGELVTRDELKRRLWPADTFGDFDHGLNKAINKIREALSDSAPDPRYVETVARRGYRFIADVTLADEPAKAPESRIAPSSEAKDDRPIATGSGKSAIRRIAAKPLTWTILAGLVAIVFILILVWKPQRLPAIRSLAVLPLENLSADLSQEYFADGMTDELITALGAMSGLRVTSRSSVMLYKHMRKPLFEVARELKVDAVLEGTVMRSGEQVRITAQLIRASTDEHLWSESYQGNLRDTLQLQDKVARAIANHIRLKITSREQAVLNVSKTVDPAAHDAYLRGRFFWNKRTEQGLKRAIDYFDQAIAIDPNYAAAYSGLADSYALLGDWEYGVLAPNEAFPKAKAAATKALQLDHGLGQAHASLALCLKSFDWDWRAAEAELLQAIHLNPSYATAHQWYAWLLIILGRNNEGISQLRNAEALDPLSLIISADIADALLIDHRYNESIQQARKTIEMDPSFAMAHFQLGQGLVQVHRYNEAIHELQQAIELSRGNRVCTSQLAYVYALSGQRDEATKALQDLKNAPNRFNSNAADIALIYVGLNENDQAFAWLEKAYEERFNPSVLLRPAFDTLRPDPRFRNLMSRLGLNR